MTQRKHYGCSVEGCTNPHQAKGYCQKHYQVLVPKEARQRYNLSSGPCSFPGCSERHYAKGLCRNHWAQYQNKLRGIVKQHRRDQPTCAATGCTTKVTKPNETFCYAHSGKYRTPFHHIDGENNPRWNGGVSQYPNHHELKKIRIKKLESVDYQCQAQTPACTGKAIETHHINGDKSDHSWDNLQPVCKKCHGYLRRGTKTMKAKYGFKLKDMAKELGVNGSSISKLIKHGKANKPLLRKLAASKYAFLLARFQRALPMDEILKLKDVA